jgi:hypothetical protein
MRLESGWKCYAPFAVTVVDKYTPHKLCSTEQSPTLPRASRPVSDSKTTAPTRNGWGVLRWHRVGGGEECGRGSPPCHQPKINDCRSSAVQSGAVATVLHLGSRICRRNYCDQRTGQRPAAEPHPVFIAAAVLCSKCPTPFSPPRAIFIVHSGQTQVIETPEGEHRGSLSKGPFPSTGTALF